MSSEAHLTRLLDAARAGEAQALGRLYELVYSELHTLARHRLSSERGDHTLQPTALVHEVFLRLSPEQRSFDDSRHFFGAAGRAMRQVLVDHARRRSAEKRGGQLRRVTLQGLEPLCGSEAELGRVLDVDAALAKLEAEHPRKARVVELRFFCGLQMKEVASALGVSRQTAQLDWDFARAWLHRELSKA